MARFGLTSRVTPGLATLGLAASGLAIGGMIACQLVLPIHESDEPDGPHLSYVAEVTADAPVLYLRLGEAKGPAAIDQRGQNNGTYPDGGITYGEPGAIQGDPDTAVAFDGTQVIAMPPCFDFSGASPFSVELWAKETTASTIAFGIDHEDWEGGTPARSGWDLDLGTAVTLERWDQGTTGGSTVSSGSALAPGGYHHVVGTFDGTSLKLYIDGMLIGSNAVTSSLPATGMAWSLGGQSCGGCSSDTGYIGVLDEVAVYQVALPQARVTAHYRAALGL